MAKKTPVNARNSLNLGDYVRIKSFAGQVGRIAELRGPLGPGGASVSRVKVQKEPRASSIELPGDQLEYLPMTGQGFRVKARRSAPKAKKDV